MILNNILIKQHKGWKRLFV